MPQRPNETLLHVSFRYRGDGDADRHLIDLLVQSVAIAPDLVWTTWLIDEANAEAGVFYLFRDAEAAARFRTAPLLQRLRRQPGVDGFAVRSYDDIDRAPLVVHRQWRTFRREESGTGTPAL